MKKQNCELWNGWKDRDGYGLSSANGKLQRVHRMVWENENGKIPDGLCVLHSCDNTSCINISHLSLGTVADNVRDMDEKKRRRPNKHESHPNSKLTEQQVLQIRSEYEEGKVTQKQLAVKFSICQVQVHRIIHNKRWKY